MERALTRLTYRLDDTMQNNVFWFFLLRIWYVPPALSSGSITFIPHSQWGWIGICTLRRCPAVCSAYKSLRNTSLCCFPAKELGMLRGSVVCPRSYRLSESQNWSLLSLIPPAQFPLQQTVCKDNTFLLLESLITELGIGTLSFNSHRIRKSHPSKS